MGKSVDDVWFGDACRAHGVWMDRHTVDLGCPAYTRALCAPQRHTQPLCRAIALRDLRKEKLSTVSTDAMTTTNL